MSMPRYKNDTLSFKLPEFSNREQDLIRQAFNSKNFTYMNKLPHRLSPTHVSNSIKLSTLDHLDRRFSSVPKKTKEFEWLPDEYDSPKRISYTNQQLSHKKQQEISAKPFKHPGVQKKLKHEDIDGKTFTYAEDSFHSAAQQATRVKWIQASHFLNKSFIPPVKSEYHVAKARIKELVAFLTERIKRDWEEVNVEVGYTENEVVEVKFDQGTVENAKALHRYMNLMQENDLDVAEFSLKKLMSSWGVHEGRSIIYCFLPPWVRIRVSDALSSLFPHSSSISSSRTGKNVPGSLKSTLYTFPEKPYYN